MSMLNSDENQGVYMVSKNVFRSYLSITKRNDQLAAEKLSRQHLAQEIKVNITMN